MTSPPVLPHKPDTNWRLVKRGERYWLHTDWSADPIRIFEEYPTHEQIQAALAMVLGRRRR